MKDDSDSPPVLANSARIAATYLLIACTVYIFFGILKLIGCGPTSRLWQVGNPSQHICRDGRSPDQAPEDVASKEGAENGPAGLNRQARDGSTSGAEDQRDGHHGKDESSGITNDTLLALISVLGLLGGALAWVFQEMVKKEVLEKAEHLNRDARCLCFALSLNASAYSLWFQFFTQVTTTKTLPETDDLLGSALELVKTAREVLGRIPSPEKYPEVVHLVSGNVAFYLACRKNLSNINDADKSEAIEASRRAYEWAVKTEDLRESELHSNAVNLAFVLCRLVPGEESTRERLKELRERLRKTLGDPNEIRLTKKLWEVYWADKSMTQVIDSVIEGRVA